MFYSFTGGNITHFIVTLEKQGYVCVHVCMHVSLYFLLHIRLVVVGLVQELGWIVKVKPWVMYYVL